MVIQGAELFEAILRAFARMIWFSLTQLLGYWTGRVTIQALSLGRFDISDYGSYNQKPFKMFWSHGKQPVVSFLVAVALGQLLWFGAFVGAVLYISRGQAG